MIDPTKDIQRSFLLPQVREQQVRNFLPDGEPSLMQQPDGNTLEFVSASPVDIHQKLVKMQFTNRAKGI